MVCFWWVHIALFNPYHVADIVMQKYKEFSIPQTEMHISRRFRNQINILRVNATSVCHYFSCMLSLIDVRKVSELKFIKNFFWKKKKKKPCFCDGDRPPLSWQLWKQTCCEIFLTHPRSLSLGRARVTFEKIIFNIKLSIFVSWIKHRKHCSIQKHLDIDDLECIVLISYDLVDASISFAPYSTTGITGLQPVRLCIIP